MPTTPAEFGQIMKKTPFEAERVDLMTRVVLTVLPYAQRETPVDTGHLRRSETTAVESDGLAGYVGTNVEYAPFVHKRMPFFETGLRASRSAVMAELQKAGDKYLAKLADEAK